MKAAAPLAVAAAVAVACAVPAAESDPCKEPQAIASETRSAMRTANDPDADLGYLKRWAVVVGQNPDCFPAGERVDAELIRQELDL